MGILIQLAVFLLLFALTGCQLPYYVKSGYSQLSLLNSRVPIDEALKDPSLSDEQKRKLRLSQKVREFAQNDLHLKSSKNYTSYVQLDRPYVTYVVNAASKWELKHYLWSYLLVGEMPYKGYFNEQDARDEEAALKKKDFDTYLRGVSAYSTLGWFQDPILSSMLNSKDPSLVDTLIHETVHATLYIKNSADFNERMAVFLGNKGTELFYLREEGPNSPTLNEIKSQDADEKIFSEFIGREITTLEQWYQNQKTKDEVARQARLAEINQRFESEVQPKLKSKSYQKFSSQKLNNAYLLLYKTYVQDLSDFEKLYALSGKDFGRFLDHCRELEKHPKPEQGLKELVARLQTTTN